MTVISLNFVDYVIFSQVIAMINLDYQDRSVLVLDKYLLSWLIRLSNNLLMKYYDRLACPLWLSKVSFHPLIPWFITKGSNPHNWSTKASQLFLYTYLQLILFLRNAQYDHQISWPRCTTLMGLTFYYIFLSEKSKYLR